MPFTVPWTDQPPADRARSVVQHHWATLGGSTPEHWRLPLAVFHDSAVVGLQDISGDEFAIRREVGTGSWLGWRYQRQGIGTEMRAAVLHLAFAGLRAEEAVSGAYAHNTASHKVSGRSGYQPDGVERHVLRGSVSTLCRYRLSRADWEARRTV